VTDTNLPAAPGTMSLLEHFRELRTRLFRSAIGIALGGVCGWVFYDSIVQVLSRPICRLKLATISSLDSCGSLYVNGVLGPLNLKISVAIFVGLILSAPVWIFQLWAFVSPALKKREKRFSLLFIFLATPFFAVGVWFGYWLLPIAVQQIMGLTPSNLTNLIRFDEYLVFILKLLLVFGIAFELPVFLIALNFMNILSGKSMLRPWRYVVFGITVFAAIFIPTGDPFTMLFLAVPMWFFYFTAALIGVFHDRGWKLKRSEQL
jgi:sec-independent protein translocase protein TatC